MEEELAPGAGRQYPVLVTAAQVPPVATTLVNFTNMFDQYSCATHKAHS